MTILYVRTAAETSSSCSRAKFCPGGPQAWSQPSLLRSEMTQAPVLGSHIGWWQSVCKEEQKGVLAAYTAASMHSPPEPFLWLPTARGQGRSAFECSKQDPVVTSNTPLCSVSENREMEDGSEEVLRTITKGYRLQFATMPQKYNTLIPSSKLRGTWPGFWGRK